MRNTSNCTLRITKSTPKKPCCSSEKTDKEAALQTLRQRFPCVRPMPRRGGINARLAYDFFRFLKRPLKALPCSLSVRLWPLLPRQGFAPSGPSPRPYRAAGRTSQPWPRCALDPSSAHSAAQKRAYSAFSRLRGALGMPAPLERPLRAAVALPDRFSSGKGVKGRRGGWRGPQRSEDTGRPGEGRRPGP